MPRTGAVLDNFNRAGPALGTDWTAKPLGDTAVALTIASSTLLTGGTSYSYNWYNLTSLSNLTNGGIEICVLISAVPGTNTESFWLSFLQQPSAASATADGYEIGYVKQSGTDTNPIGEYANAAYTLTSTGTTADFANGDLAIVRMTPAGVISAYKDTGGVETLLHTITDTTYSGTFFAGVGIYNPTGGACRLDDFSFAQLPAAAVGLPSLVMAPPIPT